MPTSQQASEKQLASSDAPVVTRGEAAEDNEPLIEDNPKSPDPENQQGTDEPQIEARRTDTEAEVTKIRPQMCVCLVVGRSAVLVVNDDSAGVETVIKLFEMA